jgi:hypothetical protein
MNTCLTHSFRPATIRLSLAALIAVLSYGSASAQISTSATLSLSPQPDARFLALQPSIPRMEQ